MTLQTRRMQYGTQDKRNQVILTTWLGAEQPSRILLGIHGGGFTAGSPAQFLQTMHDDLDLVTLAARGVALASVGYRLATASLAGYPMQVNDVVSAIGFINSQWTGAPISVLGSSAGGTLADFLALMGQCDRATSLSGPTDFPALLEYWQTHPLHANPTGVHDFAGGATDGQLVSASPINHVGILCKPLQVFGSQHEQIDPNQQITLVNAINSESLADPPMVASYKILDGSAHAEAYLRRVAGQVVEFLAPVAA